MPLSANRSSQPGCAIDRSATVVTPDSSNSLSATRTQSGTASASARNTGRYSYNEELYRPGVPTSSVSPLFIGSLDGCEWMLTSPGITMNPAPSITSSATPS
jgi:hypothetical protein